MVKPNKDNIDEKNDDSENEEMNLSDSDSDEKLPLKFRSYTPRDEKLKKYVISKSQIPNIVAEIDEKLSSAAELNLQRDILNIAPKKANWDLKRDISSKLDLLERRTQRAIVELVQEKYFQTNDSIELHQRISNLADNV